jgi:hypothetical protein
MRMKHIFNLLLFVTLLSTLLSAEMKCAPGKCGGGMTSEKKTDVKGFYKGNSDYKAIDIKADEYSCATCNMNVKEIAYASQAVKKNGDTYLFDDLGCMLLWLEKQSEPIMATYVMTLDTHRWVKAEEAHYSRIAPSPMGYGFAAVEMPKEGLISYESMKAYMLKGETLRNPVVKKSLLTD